jgi:hypothetical protein
MAADTAEQGDAGHGSWGPPGARLRIGFYVDRLTTDVASIWYRAFYPAVALEAQGHHVSVFELPPTARTLARLDALIIVKVLGPKALAGALEARRLGVPVHLDLCDDIFVPGYGGGKGREALVFRACARLADSVTTTGPVMAETLRTELGCDTPVWIVPDPAENAAFNEVVRNRFRRWARWAWLARQKGRLLGVAVPGPHLRGASLVARKFRRLARQLRLAPRRVYLVLRWTTIHSWIFLNHMVHLVALARRRLLDRIARRPGRPGPRSSGF